MSEVVMRKFLEERRDAFEERGTGFMVPMVEEMLEMSIETADDLREFVDECLSERNRHTKFSMKFMYYWSVHTYMRDMLEDYERIYG
jgi:siroheme synthase (precorrin-2 oxidase/ferrochelatase)